MPDSEQGEDQPWSTGTCEKTELVSSSDGGSGMWTARGGGEGGSQYVTGDGSTARTLRKVLIGALDWSLATKDGVGEEEDYNFILDITGSQYKRNVI